MAKQTEEKKRNKSVNFSKIKRRDQILHAYVSQLPKKDYDFVNFSEYVKGLITQDMLLRSARLGIDIEGMGEMGAVHEQTTYEAPRPQIKKATVTKTTVAETEEKEDDVVEDSPEVENVPVEDESPKEEKETPDTQETGQEKQDDEQIDYRNIAMDTDF